MQNHSKRTRAVKRHQTIVDPKQITDQSAKNSCDINNIVKQFMKTGVLPTSNKIPRFGDFSETPTLEAAFDVAHAAQEAFYQLPSAIRKMIDNDPSQLEKFISDPENNQLCVKYGLLANKKIEKAPPKTTETPTPKEEEAKPEPKKDE